MDDLLPSVQPEGAKDTNVPINDCISRQVAIDQLHQSYNLLDAERRLEDMPSAQPELPPYVAEIECEYRKAVNMPYIKKPLAKALYEVWKKHDRDDAKRET